MDVSPGGAKQHLVLAGAQGDDLAAHGHGRVGCRDQVALEDRLQNLGAGEQSAGDRPGLARLPSRHDPGAIAIFADLIEGLADGQITLGDSANLFLFKNLHLLDTVWALMLVYAAMNLSIVVWIIRSYMTNIPREIEDAARTDGASDLRILWSIIIPMCLPGIITAAVIAAIFAMNEYLLTLIIATREAYPLSVALANFSGGSDGII